MLKRLRYALRASPGRGWGNIPRIAPKARDLRATGRSGVVRCAHAFAVCLGALFVGLASTAVQADALATAINACSNHADANALDRTLQSGGLERVGPDAGKLAIDWYGIPFEASRISLTTEAAGQAKRIARLERLIGQPPEKLSDNGKAILSFSAQYASKNGSAYVATNISQGVDPDYPTDCMIFVTDAAQLDPIWSAMKAAAAPAFDPAWAAFRGDTVAQKTGGIAVAALFDRTQFIKTFQYTLKPAGYITIVNAHQPNSEATK